jgi:hypothetical protein
MLHIVHMDAPGGNANKVNRNIGRLDKRLVTGSSYSVTGVSSQVKSVHLRANVIFQFYELLVEHCTSLCDNTNRIPCGDFKGGACEPLTMASSRQSKQRGCSLVGLHWLIVFFSFGTIGGRLLSELLSLLHVVVELIVE